MTYFDSLEYRNGDLYMDDICLKTCYDSVNIGESIENENKRIYCYSTNSITTKYNRYIEAARNANITNFRICYAFKANAFSHILDTLSKMPYSGADTVSKGELEKAIKHDFSSIVFSGVGKRIDEIAYACKNNIMSINVESRDELHDIENVARTLGNKANIAVRINPSVASNTLDKISTGRAGDKFGVDLDTAYDMYEYAKNSAYLNPVGISLHIGSQIFDLNAYAKSYEICANFLSHIINNLEINISMIDVGGGLGIRYHFNDPEIDVDAYMKIVAKSFSQFISNPKVTIVFEPGRYLVGESGVLLTQVTRIHKSYDTNFTILDAGFTDILRPSYYDTHHEILNLTERQNTQTQEYFIVGPICESGDKFGKYQMNIEKNDILAICCAGAYGYVMSSTYNQRNLPIEMLIS